MPGPSNGTATALDPLTAVFERQREWGRTPSAAELETATNSGSMVWTEGQTAAAIFGRVSEPSFFSIFPTRPVVIPEGAWVVRAFSFLPGSDADGLRLLSVLRHRTGGAPLFAAAFSADAPTRAVLDAAGMSCLGQGFQGGEVWTFYGPPLEDLGPPLDAAERATLLEVEPGFLSASDIVGVLDELRTWIVTGGSRELALRAFSDDPATLGPSPLDPNERPTLFCRDTVAAPFFSRTMSFVRRLPATVERVRILELPPRADTVAFPTPPPRRAGVADGRWVRLHVPLEDGANVEAFDLEGERLVLDMIAGSLCYLDRRKPYRVRNAAAIARRHLVIDAAAGPWLRSRIGGQS